MPDSHETPGTPIRQADYDDARVLWDYHQMGHELRPCSVAIGLGSHDLGVATYAAKLYHQGYFPLLVFTGANSPTTKTRFPRGEAVHYRDEALALGVPNDRVLIETEATNTGQNITNTRALLDAAGIHVDSALLISKPYMQRRVYATTRQLWPDIDIACASEPITFDNYLHAMGDDHWVINFLVGDLSRIIEYSKHGYATEQPIPNHVHHAYTRLSTAGFTNRVVSPT